MEIENYPGYLIYEDGSIWAKKTKGRKEGWMKANPNHDGYLRLGLTNKDGFRKYFVHRLVAQTYIPNPHNYPEVDHIDRDVLNNHLYNLRWATRSMNCQNRGTPKTNKSGHKNISFDKSSNKWRFIKGKYSRRFDSKIDAICYKYIIFLKIRASKVGLPPNHLLS